MRTVPRGLVLKTVHVWYHYYGQNLTEQEAKETIITIQDFFEVLLEIKAKAGSENTCISHLSQ